MRFVNFLFSLIDLLMHHLYRSYSCFFVPRMLPSDPVEALMEGSWPAAVLWTPLP